MNNELGGKMEIAMNGLTIPASMLSEIAFDIAEGMRERATLAGTYQKPSGSQDTNQATFTLFLPSMDYLKTIFPGRYNAPEAPQTTGNVIINSDTCVETDAGPINFHYTCDEDDANDIHFYNGSAVLNFNGTMNPTDSLTIEVTLVANPDDDGNVIRFGTGDLTERSVYDAESEETVPWTS